MQAKHALILLLIISATQAKLFSKRSSALFDAFEKAASEDKELTVDDVYSWPKETDVTYRFIHCMTSDRNGNLSEERCGTSDPNKLPSCAFGHDLQSNFVRRSCFIVDRQFHLCHMQKCNMRYQEETRAGVCCCFSNNCNSNITNVKIGGMDSVSTSGRRF